MRKVEHKSNEEYNMITKEKQHMNLISTKEVVCWFVIIITQKLLNPFQQNLDGGWVSAQNRPQ